MSYVALYRKYRPLTFDDVVEQEGVVQTLKNAVVYNRIAHAYLFCGSRGTGKTSLAKIFARAINCKSPIEGNPCNACETCKGILEGRNLDVLEIDAASNNGVDNIREIRDEVFYTPSESKYKVYIIDEVHMLSTGAFNALLKTLEEPPSHVVFILATTEAHKIPATILSRCQRFDFKRITVASMTSKLLHIGKDHQVDIHEDAARVIAKLAEGGLRDAISVLDQCMDQECKTLSVEEVVAKVGMVDNHYVEKVAKAIITKDIPTLFQMVEELTASGKEEKHFISGLEMYFRDLLVLKLTGDDEKLSYPLYEDMVQMKKTAEGLADGLLIAMVRELALFEQDLKWVNHSRVNLEILLVKLCKREFSDELEALKERVSQLEKRIQHPMFMASAKQSPAFIENKKPSAGIANQQEKKSLEISAEITSSKIPVRNKKAPLDFMPVEFWEEVINELKSMGRMVLYSNLLDSKAYFKEENRVIIFPLNPVNKIAISKIENIEVLEMIFLEKFNRKVMVKVTEKNEEEIDQQENESPSLKQTKDFAQNANIPFNIIDD
jgi:DNA polymerase III subunit gamma/tau